MALRSGPEIPGGLMGHADHNGGALKSDVPGRTDKLKIKVPESSYVIPADVVSALGEGNTDAGISILDRKFASKSIPKFKKGGKVPIVAAGGEYVVSPDKVKEVGGGDIEHGHKVLAAFVKNVRKDLIKTLKKLPGPKK